jgi:hypothetical protein
LSTTEREPTSATTTHEKLIKLVELLGSHASPRELVLGVGEGLEQAIADLEDCYLLDEDDNEDNGEEGPGGKSDLALSTLKLEDDDKGDDHGVAGKSRTTLDGLIRRVILCLDVLGRSEHDISSPPSFPIGFGNDENAQRRLTSCSNCKT